MPISYLYVTSAFGVRRLTRDNGQREVTTPVDFTYLLTGDTTEMEANEGDGIPNELKERLGNFDAALSNLEATLQPLLSTSHTDLVEKVNHISDPDSKILYY